MIVLVSAVVVIVLICCYKLLKRRSGSRPFQTKMTTTPLLQLQPMQRQMIGSRVAKVQPGSTSSSLRSASPIWAFQPNIETTDMIPRNQGTVEFSTTAVRRRSLSLPSLVDPVHRPHRSISKEDHPLQISFYTKQTLGASSEGKIHFNLKYDSHLSYLVVTVIECESLSEKECGEPPDPYVVVHMPTNKKVKHQTTVKWQTRSPIFNETFVFRDVSFQSLTDCSVYFQVLDFKIGKSSKRRVIGVLEFSIETVDRCREFDTWQLLRLPDDGVS